MDYCYNSKLTNQMAVLFFENIALIRPLIGRTRVLARSTLSRFDCIFKTIFQVKRTQAATASLAPHYTRVDFNGKDGREAREAVSQYYRQHEITNSASKESVRINPAALLYTGKQDFEENDFLVINCFFKNIF